MNDLGLCIILQLKFIRKQGSLGSSNSKRVYITCSSKCKQRNWLLEDIKVGSHAWSRYSFRSSCSQTLGMDQTIYRMFIKEKKPDEPSTQYSIETGKSMTKFPHLSF